LDQTRDFLMRLTLTDLYRVHWTDLSHDGMIGMSSRRQSTVEHLETLLPACSIPHRLCDDDRRCRSGRGPALSLLPRLPTQGHWTFWTVLTGNPTRLAPAVWPGKSYPLGATWDGEGVNFALFSEYADQVELCLFDASGRHERQRIELREQTDQVWHAYLPGLRPGQLYGYRVYGPYAPDQGHRFNPHKLLLDPYARTIVGELRWSNAHFPYRIGHPAGDLSFDRRDSAPGMPKCQVVDAGFHWGDDRRPNTLWHQTVIYELHVRGFTQRHPQVPDNLRGTYAGLATPPVIDYLKRLGVTAVELLPIHYFIDDRLLLERGLRNYWGYNSIGYFAPDPRYSASGDINEFKGMVKTLHQAGLEVILDVVYNHTAEGNHLGPSLCFRGLDNAAYYRLVAENPRYYMDYTGCGNSLNMMHPRVLQLIMDSLRYWVTEMHVDGFRFDLAAALARELHEVDHLGAFLDIIHQDPVLSQVKLIAEPWDVGEGGYQVGNFPVGWTEWNGKYRDIVRDYWRGESGLLGQLAYRLTGSSDLYQHNGRSPYASINFITAHDGFTLYDLVSYNEKRNAANGDDNRDGDSHNRSWNCGAEGDTDEPEILALRTQQRRNFLATLLLSQGVPMLVAGDEMGRTQQGNNNAYCQDNELSWVNWDLAWLDDNRQLFEFVRRLLQLRREHPVFRRRYFFQGQSIHGRGVRDIIWLNPDGNELSDEQWSSSFARCFGLHLVGEALDEQDERGHWLKDDDFLLLLNAHHEAIPFTLPWNSDCQVWLDTVVAPFGRSAPHPSGQLYPLAGRSLALLGRARPGDVEATAGGTPVLRRRHFLPFGAELLEHGNIRFRLWAPATHQVAVCIQEPGNGEVVLPMSPLAGGWFELISHRARVGDQYRYRLDGGATVADPASRCQPAGVDGPSEVLDARSFAWHDGDWRGRPWETAVIYQLHVGSFTPQGTFAGVRDQLDYLVALGVTALQLMPVATFAGKRNWGDGGVLWFAPAAVYGHPNELKDLVQAAHAKGLMVFLEVDYSRFGPEGNPLPVCAPGAVTGGSATTGVALNFNGEYRETVREWVIHNALYWLEEFHLDGLCLNNAGALVDYAQPDSLEALAQAVRRGPGKYRQCHLLLEQAGQVGRYLISDEPGGARPYDGVWHGALQVALQGLLTGESAPGQAAGGHEGEPPVARLGRCLSLGLAMAGEPLPTTAAVAFLQHPRDFEQRPLGERIHKLSEPRALRAVTAMLLLSPLPPALFMGQEFAAEQPFLYFHDYSPALAKVLLAQRRQWFARRKECATPLGRARLSNPGAATTFKRVQLDWRSLEQSERVGWLEYHRQLLALRQREIIPRLVGMQDELSQYQVLDGRGLRVQWTLGDGALLSLVANLSNEPLAVADWPPGELLWGLGELHNALAQRQLPGWAVGWWLRMG
jgi:glycogen operon protein